MPFDGDHHYLDVGDRHSNFVVTNLTKLSAIKLNKAETLNSAHRTELIRAYAPEIVNVYRRVRWMGFGEQAALDCIKGFIKQFLHRFITPGLGGAVQRLAPLPGGPPSAYYRGLLTAPATVLSTRYNLLYENFLQYLWTLKERLALDSGMLAATGLVPGGAGLARLKSVEFTGSDPHHGNQVVVILGFGANKVVYKSRTTFPDHLIMGRARALNVVDATQPAQTIGEILNRLLPNRGPGYRIPLYRFLSRPEYGYVQHLKTDLEHREEKHLRRMAWLYGVYAVLSYAFGLTDMHKGNFMLCKRRAFEKNLGTRHCLAHAIDLEIAFHMNVLDQLTISQNLEQTMMLNQMIGPLHQTGELGFSAYYNFQPRANFITCTYNIWPNVRSSTENLPFPGPFQGGGQAARDRRRAFAQGFKDAWTTLEHWGERNANMVLDMFDNVKVRFHVLGTASQNTAIRNLMLSGLDPTVAGFATEANLNAIGIPAEAWNRPGAYGADVQRQLLEDWHRMDVGYYVKQLNRGGDCDLLWVTAANPAGVVVAGAADRTGGQNLIKVHNRIRDMHRRVIDWDNVSAELENALVNARGPNLDHVMRLRPGP